MIRAYPTDINGEQIGEAKTFTPLQWAKMKSTSKKHFRWKETGESAIEKERELMPVSTKKAKKKE